MSTWHCVMADGEEFMRWKISTNTVDGYKPDTKCVHSVHGRPTLKDEERFRNGLVRKPFEKSLYQRAFMSEPFIEKHAISTGLCTKYRYRNNYKINHHYQKILAKLRSTKPEFLPNIKPE